MPTCPRESLSIENYHRTLASFVWFKRRLESQGDWSGAYINSTSSRYSALFRRRLHFRFNVWAWKPRGGIWICAPPHLDSSTTVLFMHENMYQFVLRDNALCCLCNSWTVWYGDRSHLSGPTKVVGEKETHIDNFVLCSSVYVWTCVNATWNLSMAKRHSTELSKLNENSSSSFICYVTHSGLACLNINMNM